MKILIKIIKFFFIIFLVSSSIVWLSNNPGKVEVLWKNYFFQTNLLGLCIIIFSLIIFTFIVSYLFGFIKNIPRNFRLTRKEKYLKLANQSLDNIAEGLLLGDSSNIEKNARMLKKYLKNDFFSSFMLFNSSLIKNNINESRKYLRILESIPKAKYISKRGKVILLFKEKKNKELKDSLVEFCKEYPKDIWFHEKLSKIYVIENDWKMAHDTIESFTNIPEDLKDYFANLKILSGEKVIDAYRLSSSSICVVNETIKFYIEQGNIKKAAEIIDKNWKYLLCFELIESFMIHKITNEKEKLKRCKIINKILKKYINEDSNETKFSMAYASFEASIWGEAQNYLDQIKQDKWDERVINLYEKINIKTKKTKSIFLNINILPKPLWKCASCGYQNEKWQLTCSNCGSIGTVMWPKSNIKLHKENDFFKDFLNNPLRHLPKMKRENR